jgi:eukaryotic-like serine/threonine-protein kinase
MSLKAGTRLGPYEIQSPIGAGGMGEVYKARDTRLERIVAIKILPDHLSDRANLRERFEREAKTIASLNHPHICTLFDTGHQDDVDYLVMEYIEGETLAQRLSKGPLPLGQVLQYAIEIADALDKAHRKGITHRDLKPGNIMLTKSGTKLLDFGLAKLAQDASPVTSNSQLPTIQDAITADGTILGTLQYMAPEQVEGKEADARTDIFAFGVVVYEMATGKKAFEGKSQASLMAKILETDPPSMSALAPMMPPALDHVVKRCLAKDPDDRWQSARDICEQLRWISESGTQTSPAAPSTGQQKPPNRIALLAIATVVAIAVVAAAFFYLRRTPPVEIRAVRFTIGPPEKGAFNLGLADVAIALSPDGSKVVFSASAANGGSQLWVRALDLQSAQALPGTQNGTVPFWSPDSRAVAFSAEGKLKKITLSTGAVETLAELTQTRAELGDGPGTWSREGVVLFVSSNGTLARVAESGGTITPVTTLDASRSESAHLWPYFLPDGRHFLYLDTSIGKPENNAIFVGSLDSKDRKMLVKVSSNPIYVNAGYLLYNRQGTLLAQPFDADRLQLTGDAIPIAEGVAFNPFGSYAQFAASDNGVLVYRGGGGSVPLTLAWVSREGAAQPLAATPHNYTFPKISPDGKRVAVGIEEGGGGQVWIYDTMRDAMSRLTFEGTSNVDPLWTRDGKRIVFKGKGNHLFWQPADGGGGAEQLTSDERSRNDLPGNWSPDGQALLFLESLPVRELFVLSLKDRKAQPFDTGDAGASSPCFSPDGRWIAYTSNESGRTEVYVRPYPGPGGKWQISTEGGGEPVWNPKGRELFYRSGQKMMAVDYTEQPEFSAGKPKMLFEGPYVPSPRSWADYDMAADGQRFLMLKNAEQKPGEISVVLNWTEELKQKVSAGSK